MYLTQSHHMGLSHTHGSQYTHSLQQIARSMFSQQGSTQSHYKLKLKLIISVFLLTE